VSQKHLGIDIQQLEWPDFIGENGHEIAAKFSIFMNCAIEYSFMIYPSYSPEL
jgi:hypothetical protein